MIMLQKITHSHTTKYSNNSTERYDYETKKEHQTEDKNDRRNEKSVIILGDSIVKHLNGWELSKRLPRCKVYVKHLSGSKAQCIKYYLKPSLRQNPSHFILHVGSNDLTSEKSSKAIAKEIMNIAVSIKSEAHDVSVLTNIIVRTDIQQLNLKAIEVNNLLADFCKEMNFSLIDNSKPVQAQYLNNSRLHLNKKGSQVLSDVYCKEIVKITK